MDPLSNFKSSQFVSQYKGLPIDAFKQTADVLQQRNLQNKAAMDKLDMLAYQTEVYGEDEGIKQAQLQKIRAEQERIAATGAYENAGDLVRMQGKEFMQNSALNQARSNYQAIQKAMTEADEHSPAQKALFQLALSKYKGVGEPDEFGKYNKFSYSYHDDPDINKAIDDFVDDWKADKTAWAEANAGYITTGSTESVTEEEVRSAAVRMLMANPEYRRAIVENANYNVYQRTGNLEDMAGNPADYDMSYTVKDKNGKDVVVKQNMLQSYLGELVDPYAAREAYSKRDMNLKGDATWGAKFTAAQQSVVPQIVVGSTINDFGNMDYDAFKNEMQNNASAISSYKQQLANTSQEANPGEYNRIQGEIATLEARQKDMQTLKDNYRSEVENNYTQEEKNRLAFFDVVDNGTFGNLKSAKGDARISNPIVKQYVDEFIKVYGVEAARKRGLFVGQNADLDNPQNDPSTVIDIGLLQYEVDKGRSIATESYFGNDFDAYLQEQTKFNSRTPNVLVFSQDSKDTKANLQSVIAGANIEVYGSNNKKDSDPNTIAAIKALATAGDLTITGAALDETGRVAVNIGQINLDDKKYDNLDKKVKKVIQKAQESGTKQFFVGNLGTNSGLALATQQERAKLEQVVMNADQGVYSPAVVQAAATQLNTLNYYDMPTQAKSSIEEALGTGLEVTIPRYNKNGGPAGNLTVVRSQQNPQLLKVVRPNGTFVVDSQNKPVLYSPESLISQFFNVK